VVLNDKDIIMRARRPLVMREAKAIVLSKIGSRIVEPGQTRLVVVNSLASRIFDRTLLILIQEQLWATVGTYQAGFRAGHSCLEHIVKVLRHLKVCKKGRKSNHAILFVDFKRAFDFVSRPKLLSILEARISEPWLKQLLYRFLLPQRIFIDEQNYFW